MNPEPADTPHRPRRQRNRRGQGYLLRHEIIAAATAILERTGTEEAVTLRAIAREIGITAPSIANHFADRAAIIDAVVAGELTHLADRIDTAAAAEHDPVERYLAITKAYVRFGQEHPARYRVVFERRYLALWDAEQRPMIDTDPLVTHLLDTTIAALQTCIDTGRSLSTDALTDNVAVWYFLHGLVAIPATLTSFPWPNPQTHLVTGVTRLAQLTNPH